MRAYIPSAAVHDVIIFAPRAAASHVPDPAGLKVHIHLQAGLPGGSRPVIACIPRSKEADFFWSGRVILVVFLRHIHSDG